ncbi:MAG: translation initiation factor IF-2 [Candidatus Goldbacteria bacterium]|nr:translation initiation factor IF-2 [Candidatus Goldiibacteriota bacterium]
MRIYEIAKKLNIDSKQIMELLNKEGHSVKSHMNTITEEEIKIINDKLNKSKGEAKVTDTKKDEKVIKEQEEQEVKEVKEVRPVKEIKVEQATQKTDEKQSIPQVALHGKKENKNVIEISRSITVGELAKQFEIKSTELIKKFFSLGLIVTINQTLTEEEIQIVSSEFGKEVRFKDVTGDDLFITEAEDKAGDLTKRDPIVTIMGHVDHGKTSLLDAIRESNLVSKETGGITQKIGAYKVETPHGGIVFLDTPGHAAFTAMRARGAKGADIVVLIVAADDGVMPQTVEAINHAKAADVPIIVAINKIDKEGVQPERIKQELTKYNLVPEEWGGKTQFVLISAKKRIGIQELLEKIILEAEMLELKTNVKTMADGIIIEGRLDKGRGPVGTVLVQRGTLKVGDPFITNWTYGKVRAIFNDKGEKVKEAMAVAPVEILGFEDVPNSGDKFRVLESEKQVKEIATKRSIELRRISEEKKKKKMTLEDFHKKIKLGAEKKLYLILKGDTMGSIEAISDAIIRISAETDVNIQIIHKDVGDITENDVLLADASDAIIIGFFVSTLPAAKELAVKEGVEIKIYHIIYEVVDAIKASLSGMLEPEYETVKIGEAEVRQQFFVESENKFIAGSYLKFGKAYHDSTVSVFRGNKEILKGRVESLKRFKDNVKEVKEKFEFGVIIDGYKDIQPGDVLVFYHEIQKVKKI